MKTCNGCKYAKWNRSNTGRLSPTGDGICIYEYKIPPLPASRYWIATKPCIGGGFINRKEEYKEHCPYYMAGEP